MLRKLINVVRYALQALRKHIKPLILVASFVTFVWLIVDTAHRPEFVRHASQHSFRHNRTADPAERWDQRSVQRFLDLLEIDLNVSSAQVQQLPLASCQPAETVLFTAFAGSTLQEHLWHYVSLVALRTRAVRSRDPDRIARVMLTFTAVEQLRQLFVSLPIEVIDERAIECYDIAAACILNDDTNIELPVKGSQLYILNNNAMRLREILEVSWEEADSYFKFDPNKQKRANDILMDLRQHTNVYDGEPDGASLQFVGINISDDDGLPFEYYYRAITFLRKIHDTGRLAFVALCEDPQGAICSSLNAPSEQITVMRQPVDPAVGFALMTLCNHTIVSGDGDIFPALLRGRGNTVVYGQQDARSRIAGIELANYKDRWYTLV